MAKKSATWPSAALGGITKGIEQPVELIGEITITSNEQSQDISEIHAGLTQIDHNARQDIASLQNASATSEELPSRVDQLHVMLKPFQPRDNGGLRRIFSGCLVIGLPLVFIKEPRGSGR